jgi:cold shock CspA family protein
MNTNIIKSNLGCFTRAYGLQANGDKLLKKIIGMEQNVHQVGIILRDPVSKKNFIICKMPKEKDITASMVWIPIQNKNLEAVPVFSRYPMQSQHPKNSLNHMIGYDKIDEKIGFSLIAHRSFRIRGIIERFFPKKGFGFIRRNSRDIFFLSCWCDFDHIHSGQEVSFMPLITRKGLQAKNVEIETPL